MVKPVLNQFNGGEISPWLEGRIDLPKYNYSAARMLNFIPLVEGGVKRRGGSHFVAPVKEVDAVLFKIVVEPSEATVYINNEIADELYVAPGEKVSYSVKLDGYFPVSGTYVVEEDTTLNISLVSTLYRATLTVKTIPEDADAHQHCGKSGGWFPRRNGGLSEGDGKTAMIQRPAVFRLTRTRKLRLNWL